MDGFVLFYDFDLFVGPGCKGDNPVVKMYKNSPALLEREKKCENLN